jgi:hypothetical protein
MTAMLLYVIWVVVLGWCMSAPSLLAQPPDPLALLERVKARHQFVHDFKAEVAIDVDVDFLRLPIKTAQVFYKHPDKWKFKAKGFMMLPRKGVQFSVSAYLEAPFSAFYVTSTVVDRGLVDVVKIVPLKADNDLVLATLWIDRETASLQRVEVHTRSAGTYQVMFVYGDAPLGLPVQTVITFEMNRTQLPLKYLGRLKIDPQKLGDQAQGTVTLSYSKFRVNEGIDETVFQEEEISVSE